MVPENYIQRILEFAKQGFKSVEFRTYDTDWDSEAYLTVSGQNSNNSVRVTNDFLNSVVNEKKIAAIFDWLTIKIEFHNDGQICFIFLTNNFQNI